MAKNSFVGEVTFNLCRQKRMSLYALFTNSAVFGMFSL